MTVTKELGTLFGIVAIGSIAISAPLGSPLLILTTALSLIIFIAPALFWIAPLHHLDRIEKIAASFLFLFGTGALWFLNDVTIKIPYTTTSILYLSVLVSIAGVLYWRKHYFSREVLASSQGLNL